jgi:membrane protease YdiL (CAAX protease family)
MIGIIAYVVILVLIIRQYFSDRSWFSDRFFVVSDLKTLLPELKLIPFLLLFSLGSVAIIEYVTRGLPLQTYFWIKYDLNLVRSNDLFTTILLAITLGPLLEEVGFRGFLFDYLTKKKGLIIGIFGNALIFGLMHKFSFVHTTVIGIVLSVVYFRTSNIFSSGIIHAVFNLTVIAYALLAHAISKAIPASEDYFGYSDNLIVAIVFLVVSAGPLWSYFDNHLKPILDQYWRETDGMKTNAEQHVSPETIDSI